jgi:hypothetical protein
MKKVVLMAAIVMIFGLTTLAQAGLVNHGNGLIYDTDLNITWLQDANYAKTSNYDVDGGMNWDTAVAWADQLVYGGYSDWRLPTTPYVDGYENKSEMGHLYYDELRNMPGTAGFTNHGPFNNLEAAHYWTGTEWPNVHDYTYDFRFLNGYGNWYNLKYHEYLAMAVHKGDIGATVPIPAAAWLLGSGFIGLVEIRRKINK